MIYTSSSLAMVRSWQVTINGEAVLNATLADVEERLEQLPAQLEVGQPVLQEPLYLREAGKSGRGKGGL